MPEPLLIQIDDVVRPMTPEEEAQYWEIQDGLNLPPIG